MTTGLQGTIETLSIASDALGCTKQVQVYLPPGYATADIRYPVLYLFRNHEREWLNPTEDDSRSGRTAATITDEMIAAGAVPPLILVMPGLGSEDGAIPSMGLNMRAPEQGADHPGLGSGRFAEYVVQDLIPAVDRALRTVPSRTHRAVDGFSLGGLTAISLALRHPELFASAGAFDGTFLWPANTKPDGAPDPLPDFELLAPAFGAPPDPGFLRSINPADLALGLDAATVRSVAFHIESCPAEKEPMANYHRTQRLVQILAEKGATNSFASAVLPDSEHKWWWADEHLKRTLPLHGAVFASPR